MEILRKGIFVSVSLFSVISFCLNSYSQVSEKTIISGITTDELTGEPLPFVSVVIKGTTVGTVSDSKGKYRIETSVKGTEISFSFIG